MNVVASSIPLREIRCRGGHTELNPAKEQIRAEWINSVPKDETIISISHAALTAFFYRQHKGIIQLCDIDEHVRAAINNIRIKREYPSLNIAEPGGDIAETCLDVCRSHGANNIGAVDVDLEDSIKTCWPVLRNTLLVLACMKVSTLVTFTFCMRDQQFNGGAKPRVNWLMAQIKKEGLGERIKLDTSLYNGDGYQSYRSARYGRHAQWSNGSAMCVVALKLR